MKFFMSRKAGSRSAGKKLFLLISILLIAASCAKNPQPVSIIPSPSPTQTPEPSPTINPSKTIYIEWTFKKLPDGKYDEPFSQIGLKLSGAITQSFDLGKFSNCSISNEDFDPEKHNNQLTALFCWWAGAGDHLTILWNKEDEITIYREEMDENPEGKRYDPELIKTIPIPRGLSVQVVEGE